MKNTVEKVKAKKGLVIVLTAEGSKTVKDLANDVIYMPDALELLSPLLIAIPLHLLDKGFGY